METFIPIIGLILAFLITAILGFYFIPLLKRLHFGQTILEIGPKWHADKKGTPVMGGIMFIIGIFSSVILTVILSKFLLSDLEFQKLSCMVTDPASQNGIRTTSVLLGLLMALANGFVGFTDDYIKVVKKRNLGLTARQKTLLQLVIAAVYLFSIYICGYTFTFIPFVGQVDVTSGAGIIFWPIALVFIYGFVNSVNLTDGIDGLCSSVTLAVSFFYMIFSSLNGYTALNIFSCASAGGCSGFLVWNLKPAKVFMGDTGSLFLGGTVVAMAFASGYPILLLPVGIVYLMEAFSVILQVLYYKKTRKRLFKMSPIHHHFEMSGWSENKIVVVFSAITLIGGVIAGGLLIAAASL